MEFRAVFPGSGRITGKAEVTPKRANVRFADNTLRTREMLTGEPTVTIKSRMRSRPAIWFHGRLAQFRKDLSLSGASLLMGDKMSRKSVPPEKPAPAVVDEQVAETPMEALSSICAVLVVGLFILTFLCQNFVIPSGSMEKTLLVGDHLVVDRITLAPSAKWMPLFHYREPMRGDIMVFIKPVPDLDADGKPDYL